MSKVHTAYQGHRFDIHDIHFVNFSRVNNQYVNQQHVNMSIQTDYELGNVLKRQQPDH